MTRHRLNRQGVRRLVHAVSLTATLLWLSPAAAAPGAHGPNGEHPSVPGAAVSPSGLARLPDGSVNVPKAAQRRMAIRTVLQRSPPPPPPSRCPAG